MGLDLRFELRGGAVATAGLGKAVARWGGPVLPAVLLRLMDGAAAGQADDAAYKTFSVAAGGAFDFDLKGGGGETNLNGQALNWQKLKLLVVALSAPAAGAELWFGPQGRANAAPLWFPDATAASKRKVRAVVIEHDPNDGWPVGATTKVVSLTNPTGSAIAGYLFAAGVKT